MALLRSSDGASELATWHIEPSFTGPRISSFPSTSGRRPRVALRALPFGSLTAATAGPPESAAMASLSAAAAATVAADSSGVGPNVAPSRVPFVAATTQISGVMGLHLTDQWLKPAAASANAARATQSARSSQVPGPGASGGTGLPGANASFSFLPTRKLQQRKGRMMATGAQDARTLRRGAEEVEFGAREGGSIGATARSAKASRQKGFLEIVGVQWPNVKFRVRLGPASTKLVSGAIAGAVSRTVTAPLETIRTHLMVGGAKSRSAVGIFNMIMARDGWTGLFRGNGIQVLRCAPSRAIELYTYETVKRALTPEDGQPSRIPFRLPLPVSSIAGATGGMASTLVTYPLELVKTRLTINPDVYRGMGFAFSKIVREEGVLELYRGLMPSVFGIIPYAGANYCFYDSLCNAYRRATGCERIEPLATLAIGSVAGAFASAATFPFEVARKKMQMGTVNGGIAYRGLMHCLQTIAKEEGMRGLFRGVVPSCVKLMPAAGISFMCYEALKTVFIEEGKEC